MAFLDAQLISQQGLAKAIKFSIKALFMDVRCIMKTLFLFCKTIPVAFLFKYNP